MSCLFDSMVALLGPYGVKIANSAALRQRVVQYMRANPKSRIGSGRVSRSLDNGRCQRCDKPGHRSETCPSFQKAREDDDDTETVSRWLEQVSADLRTDSQGYLARMSHVSSWGGGMELAVLSKMYSIRILVHRGGRVVATFDATGGHALADFHLRWTGSHYTPMRFVETLA